MNSVNRKTLHIQCMVIVCTLVLCLMSSHAFAASADTIQVLKIAPQDARAIIKTPDGKMQIINVGDVLGGTGSGLRVAGGKDEKPVASSPASGTGELRVVEITTDRVVIEEKTATGVDRVIFRLENGVQRVERVRK